MFVANAKHFAIGSATRAGLNGAAGSGLLEPLSDLEEVTGRARASAYMDLHGRITFGDVARGLERDPTCPKLTTYWHYRGCSYAKLARSCSAAELLDACPVPQHDLRNGRLNLASDAARYVTGTTIPVDGGALRYAF